MVLILGQMLYPKGLELFLYRDFAPKVLGYSREVITLSLSADGRLSLIFLSSQIVEPRNLLCCPKFDNELFIMGIPLVKDTDVLAKKIALPDVAISLKSMNYEAEDLMPVHGTLGLMG
ncbi:hypothetical protein J1N35_028037 [Gossypium stocksii]|uniref:Uncharacterized protein n=1 Tax=Gossypium stocksii TaxID=47602 RepID=A0A9D3UVM0_9ROSI|nr:hypothetical protein J1N35_028037 [Gossypium stocksii]